MRQVHGHVNFGQKPEDARKLSQERAEMVMFKLRKKGVADNRMKAVGHGYDRPR